MENSLFLGVPILKHITILSCPGSVQFFLGLCIGSKLQRIIGQTSIKLSNQMSHYIHLCTNECNVTSDWITSNICDNISCKVIMKCRL